MEHPEYWPYIDALAEGQLVGPDAERLRAHLAGCDDCSRRLQLAEREVSGFREALSPAEPPPDFVRSVMARVEQRDAKAARSLRYAVAAGVAGNLITAAVLLSISLRTTAPVALVVGVALLGALIWGGLKGLCFGWGMRFLPEGLLSRGLFFGALLWAITNGALAVAGGLGSGDYSVSFVLLGSLAHHLIYGLLISWLYARFTVTGRTRAEA